MSVKVILFSPKVYADGKSPVMVQVIINRKVYRKNIFAIEPKHYDKKKNTIKPSHPNFNQFNILIQTTLVNIERKILEAKVNNINIDKDYLFSDKKAIGTSLIEIIDLYIEKLDKEKKWSTIDKMTNIRKKLISTNYQIDKMSEEDLKSIFLLFLQENQHNTAAKNINNLLAAIRHYNKTSPIDVDKSILNYNIKYKPTTKPKLSKEEFLKLKNIALSGYYDIARDYFVVSFFLRGMRISDVLTLQRAWLNNGVLNNTTRKTDKLMIVTVPQVVLDIFAKYNHPVYLMPLMTMLPPDDPNDKRYTKAVESKTAIINKHLKVVAALCGIDKNLTTHMARHTLAYLADQFGMTAKRIQDLLTHSDLKTTQNYIHDLNNADMLDKAMDEFIESME